MATAIHRSVGRGVLICAAVMLASGCTKTFALRPVDPTAVVYAPQAHGGPVSISVSDGRADRTLHTGTLKVRFESMEGGEVAYLATSLATVLNARGIDVRSGVGDGGEAVLRVRSYLYRNLRSNGFAPYHTFATLSADLSTGGETHRIAAYFKGSKTPMWAFSEVERPCYQITTDALVNEIAAKMNRILFGRAASDQVVEQIAASIKTEDADASTEEYRKVLALGYTNNPIAVGRLVPLTAHPETLMRAAALSSLGTLGATDQLDLLRKAYETNTGVAKVMAAKAIADLGTPEARAFVMSLVQSKVDTEDRLRDVLSLYQ